MRRSFLSPVRNIRRYHVIASAFARHGFGSFLEAIHLESRISLPRRILRQKPPPHVSAAEHLRLALEELGPTFIKLGQILSTRPDLLPPDFIGELAKLTDSVPPVSWEAIHAEMTKELGDKPEKIFAQIDPVPLAAASLAQVHAATLTNGDQAVVKIQRPRIQAIIDTDLDILRDLATLAQRTPLGELYNPKEVLEEFAFTLRNELDYRREGRNADRFRENFKDEKYLHIPQIYWEYSTERLLVMERIQGIAVGDIEALDAAQSDRSLVALNAARIIIKEVLQDGFFHADPHTGNFLVLPGEVIGAMDFGMVGHLSDHDRRNLIRLYISAISMDANNIVEQLISMNIADDKVDRIALEHEINRLLNKYYGLPLKDIRTREIIDEIMPIAFHYRLRLPSELWLLGKTMAMMEGLGLRLDPDFDIFSVSEPYVQQLKRQYFIPNRQWGDALLQRSINLVELIEMLPRSGKRLLKKAEQGDLFEIRIKETGRFLTVLDRLVMRLSLSILVAAFVVSLAILIPVTTGSTLARVLAVSGFLITIGLGIWLLISILRAKR
ncbi:MAG: AarF/ABC1/UbiB kinase family protein [Anaerolineales bacterium]|nr:AarF/ABC1/UbiB kinase family protein [Anaerolineales bacterium]